MTCDDDDDDDGDEEQKEEEQKGRSTSISSRISRSRETLKMTYLKYHLRPILNRRRGYMTLLKCSFHFNKNLHMVVYIWRNDTHNYYETNKNGR